MRLRNEKYSYRLWMVLNPDREKENEWWFQFFTMDQIWQDIKVISNHRLSVSLPRQNRMFSFWVIRKDLLLERHKLTFSEWLLQSLHQIIRQTVKADVYSETPLAPILSHQTSENSKHDITQTTWHALQSLSANQIPSKPCWLQDTQPPRTSIIRVSQKAIVTQTYTIVCLCYRTISQNIKTNDMLWELQSKVFFWVTLGPNIYICYPAKHCCTLASAPYHCNGAS